MPNWCYGLLKVRGKKEYVINFLTNGLFPVDIMGNDIKQCGYYIDEYGDINYNPSEKLSCFWIEGTERGFVYPNEYYFNCYDVEKDEVIICLDAKFAYIINAEQLVKVSKKYDIDFKIYAFMKVMESNLDIEVIQGKLIKNERITFDNYVWECIDPFIGD